MQATDSGGGGTRRTVLNWCAIRVWIAARTAWNGGPMLHMALGMLLAFAALHVEAADAIPKGDKDLLRDSTLSQSFTVFDELLLSLDRNALVVARVFRPKNGDFRPSHNEYASLAISRVNYDKDHARIVIAFDLAVSGIDDPWRDVCAKRVREIVGPEGLWLPRNESNVWQMSARTFFTPLLGPRIFATDPQLEGYKAFSDSIVVALQFRVESGVQTKPLKFIRECFWDNKTGKVSFREYKY